MRLVSTTRRRLVLGSLVLVLSALGVVAVVVRRADGPVRPLGRNSPVVDAARADDLASVRTIISGHGDVNLPGRDGASALLWAAYNGDVEMAKSLIAAGATVDAANRYGVRPLMQASRTGDLAMIAALLEAGADSRLAHPEGETPLMAVARAGNVEAVRLLLARGAEVNASDASQKQTALMWAVAEGHTAVVDVLLGAGADPNLKAHVTSLTNHQNADYPTGGFTALMWAARNGSEDIVRRLVKAGANLNITNSDGATATIIAIVNDRFDLAATLLELGADANDGALYHATDMRDATTDMYALDGSQLRTNHPNQLTALDLVKRLLDRGADPNKPFVGQLHSISLCCGDFVNASAFYRAAVAADVETMKLMIERGADLERSPSKVKAEGTGTTLGTPVGANDNVGRAPILMAVQGGRGALLGNGPGFRNRQGPPPFREPSNRQPLDAVVLLLEAGANPDAAVPDGSTALHLAAQSGRLDVIRVLAKAGAKLDRRNKDGRTPLDLAEGKQPEDSGEERASDGASPQAVAALLRSLMGQPPLAVASAPQARLPTATRPEK